MMSETCVCYVGRYKYRMPYPSPVVMHIPIIPEHVQLVEQDSGEPVLVQIETWIQSCEAIYEPIREHAVYYRREGGNE